MQFILLRVSGTLHIVNALSLINKRSLTAVALALFTAAPYLQVVTHDFLVFDDYAYIVMNSWTRQGLTSEGLQWAFSTFTRGNWHPLTWVSHMLDVTLFGMNAGGHHLVNVALHVLSTTILFAALRSMTGALWRSAFVAALFGVHPLHVESVAWLAERKDVLSGFFFMATLLAYVRYVRRPGLVAYLPVVLLFTFGIMAKSMLVTLPFVLLLADIWPLGRTTLAGAADGPGQIPRSWGSLLLEKAPLFCLAVVVSVVTYIAQTKGQSVVSFETLPLGVRLGNAAVSYAAYLVKAVWPSSLAVFYPYPAGAPAWWKLAGAAAIIFCISGIALHQLRRRPFLAMGWSWYILMLLPVIGIIQVGEQAMADRYTYLPLIGPFIMLTWLIPELIPDSRGLRRKVLGGAAVAALLMLWGLTYVQTGYWRNGIVLFEHTLSVTSNNAAAHNSLGAEYGRQGRYVEASAEFIAALKIKNNDVQALRNLGLAFVALGRMDDAIAAFSEAVRLRPEDKLSRSFLEHYLAEKGGRSGDTNADPGNTGGLQR